LRIRGVKAKNLNMKMTMLLLIVSTNVAKPDWAKSRNRDHSLMTLLASIAHMR